MNLSSVEILAGILIVLAVVKLLVIFVNARAWIMFVKRFYSNPNITSLVALTLAGFVLYLLLQSGLTIVQILAVCLFVMLLIVVGIAPYSSQLFQWFETQDLRLILKEQWLYIMIWLLLLGWGAYELFNAPADVADTARLSLKH